MAMMTITATAAMIHSVGMGGPDGGPDGGGGGGCSPPVVPNASMTTWSLKA
jgi:hypothetical protein